MNGRPWVELLRQIARNPVSTAAGLASVVLGYKLLCAGRLEFGAGAILLGIDRILGDDSTILRRLMGPASSSTPPKV